MILVIKDGMECLHDSNMKLPVYDPPALTPVHELHILVEQYVYNIYNITIDHVDVLTGDSADGLALCTGNELSKQNENSNFMWIDLRLMHMDITDAYHETYKKLYCLNNYMPCEASIFRIFYRRLKAHLENGGNMYRNNLEYIGEGNYDAIARVTQLLLDKKDTYPKLPPPVISSKVSVEKNEEKINCTKSQFCSRGYNHRGLCNRCLA